MKLPDNGLSRPRGDNLCVGHWSVGASLTVGRSHFLQSPVGFQQKDC